MWGAVFVFLLVSLWWLTRDDRVPDFDSGLHMMAAITYQSGLVHGPHGLWFTDYDSYPPLVHLVGAASIFLAGIHPMALVMSSNVVFVPLLAFGCYGTGRLVAGPRAGLLAGLFALGTPMFVSMMHEYLLDGPQTAMVAVTVWAVLASRRFQRTRISALAGVVFGLALMTKETSVVFVAGLLLVVILRGGWRSWRGLVAFAGCAAIVAAPWYIYHQAKIRQSFTGVAQGIPNAFQAPPRFSSTNVTWYIWNLLNEQTLTVFAGLFLIGGLIALWRCLRHRIEPANVYPELLAGALVSYLGMTYLTHKDPRYSFPALVYIAVLGTSWIPGIGHRSLRRVTSVTVAGLAGLYLVGMSFGLGGAVRIALPGAQDNAIYQRQLTLYETSGWVRGGATTDAHVLSLLEGLRSAGVSAANLYTGGNEIDFNTTGIEPLMESAGIHPALAPLPPGRQNILLLVHIPHSGEPVPCQRLNDGVGIYVARGSFAALNPVTLTNPADASQPFTFVCPGRAPQTYPRAG
jgi:4-amino-4-deoxy-L-arabinose transferase-like glycosyltransferase